MKDVCPTHPKSRMKPIPTDVKWKRCDHIGEKGGRCKFTRSS